MGDAVRVSVEVVAVVVVRRGIDGIFNRGYEPGSDAFMRIQSWWGGNKMHVCMRKEKIKYNKQMYT